MSAIRIYLAWQRIADGRAQIRKWSPDRISPNGGYSFLGFESQTKEALAWLAENGEPTWPECLYAETPKLPFVTQVDEGQFKAWESGRIKRYQEAWGHFVKVGSGEIDENIGIYTIPVINEAATVDADALAGVMRTLKQHKGE